MRVDRVMKMDEKTMTECRYSESEGRSSHFHNAYEMLYVRGGTAVVTVSAKEYEVEANTLMFFSNLEEHVTKIVNTPFRRYFVKLDPDLLNRRLASHSWQLSIFKNRPEGFLPFVKVDRYAEEIDMLFRILLREYENPDEYSNDMVESALRQILTFTYRCAPDRFASYNQADQINCAQMQRWIETHFTEEIQIKDITANFYISSSHFSRVFKKATGYTPKQYLMLNRITYAKELLLHSDLNVGEVAHRSGFMDESNFIRYFNRAVGTTPNKYRKLMERR